MFTIKKKLTISFLIIALLTLLIGVVSLFNFQKINRIFEEMIDKTMNVSVTTKDLSLLLSKIVSEIDVMVLSRDLNSLKEINDSVVDKINLFKQEIEKIKKAQISNKSRRDLQEIESKLAQLTRKREDVFKEISELITLEGHLLSLSEQKVNIVNSLDSNIAVVVDNNAFLNLMAEQEIDSSREKVGATIKNFTDVLFVSEKAALSLNRYLKSIELRLLQLVSEKDTARLVPIQDNLDSDFKKAAEQCKMLETKINDKDIKAKITSALKTLDESRELAIGKKDSIYAYQEEDILKKDAGNYEKIKKLHREIIAKLEIFVQISSVILDNNEFEILMAGDDIEQKLKGIENSTRKFTNKILPVVKDTLVLKARVTSMADLFGQILKMNDGDMLRLLGDNLAIDLNKAMVLIKEIKDSVDEEGRDAVQKIEVDLKRFEDIVMAEDGVIRTRNKYISVMEDSEGVVNECKKNSDEMVALFDIILDEVRKDSNNIILLTKGVIRGSRVVVITVILAALILSLILSFVSIRGIISPINKMVGAIKSIAEGDLTKKIAVNGRDEIGEMAGSFSIMVTNLNRILSQMQKAVNDITSAGNEILAASEQQAAGAREQSSAVTETTSAAAELSKTSEQIGEKIRTVSNTAQHVMAGMLKIKEAIGKTGATITLLNEKTQKISKITELIDDVTDQTNLLAVNAAIEAARAGEQGRGFTVVADEIRKLSDSTAKSTKDIVALIETIQNEVSNAIISMEESVKSVERQLQSAHESAEHAEDIAMSVTQQVSGTRQIAEAMGNIDETMRQIVSGAQQAQDASRHLTKLAGELKETSAKFRILDGELKNGV